MARTPSSLAAAADAVLQTKGQTLRDWLSDQLDDGAGTRLIASRMHVATDGIVSPTHETVRRWIVFYDLNSPAAA
jgi:hypothetical protein